VVESVAPQQAVYHGVVSTDRLANLSFVKAGQIVEIPVTIGQSVASGELLARIQFNLTDTEVAQGFTPEAMIRAPFSGVISQVYVSPLNQVIADQAIVQLQDLNRLRIDLDERFDDVRAIATFESIPGKTYKLNSKDGAFIFSEMSDTDVRAGMTALVQILDTSKTMPEMRITIPLAAVFADAHNTPFVWVVDRQTLTVHQRRVETGNLIGDARIEIIQGLTPGETVAVSSVNMLKADMKVRLGSEESH
jgi:multidrug efflux pump subunit AcrA (membrane-fusion protein)